MGRSRRPSAVRRFAFFDSLRKDGICCLSSIEQFFVISIRGERRSASVLSIGLEPSSRERSLRVPLLFSYRGGDRTAVNTV